MIKMPGIPESISKVRLVRFRKIGVESQSCKYIYMIKIAKEGVGFVQFAFFFAFKWGF